METEYAVEGRWYGRVLRAEQGEGGFGYDPLFAPDELPEGQEEQLAGKSAGELTAEQKDAVSHRGKALRQLVEILAQLAD